VSHTLLEQNNSAVNNAVILVGRRQLLKEINHMASNKGTWYNMSTHHTHV